MGPVRSLGDKPQTSCSALFPSGGRCLSRHGGTGSPRGAANRAARPSPPGMGGGWAHLVESTTTEEKGARRRRAASSARGTAGVWRAGAAWTGFRPMRPEAWAWRERRVGVVRETPVRTLRPVHILTWERRPPGVVHKACARALRTASVLAQARSPPRGSARCLLAVADDGGVGYG